MAQITFRGMCSGTITKTSMKSGAPKPYQITSFVEVPSLKTFEVFGDLGLAPHEDVREYVLEANITGLGNVVVKSGSVAPSKKS